MQHLYPFNHAMQLILRIPSQNCNIEAPRSDFSTISIKYSMFAQFILYKIILPNEILLKILKIYSEDKIRKFIFSSPKPTRSSVLKSLYLIEN